MTHTNPKIVDLRSDTLSLPTNEMKVAMFNAEVGDAVFGEDPTLKSKKKSKHDMLIGIVPHPGDAH